MSKGVAVFPLTVQAQFEPFHATGLALDHVDAHHHMHLHPTVAALLVRIGRDFGLKAVRVPLEPEDVLAPAGDPPQLNCSAVSP